MRKQIQTVNEATPTELLSSIKDTLKKIHKWRGAQYESYFQTTIYNTPEFQYLKRVPGLNLKGDVAVPKYEIDQNIVDAVKSDWMDIQDKEIVSSDGMKFMISAVSVELMLGNDIKPSSITTLNRDYQTYFKERVDFDRMKRIFREQLIKRCLSMAKSLPHSYMGPVEVDEIGIYVDKFLNGTPYAKSFSTPKDSTTSNIDNSTDLKGLWRKKGDK